MKIPYTSKKCLPFAGRIGRYEIIYQTASFLIKGNRCSELQGSILLLHFFLHRGKALKVNNFFFNWRFLKGFYCFTVLNVEAFPDMLQKLSHICMIWWKELNWKNPVYFPQSLKDLAFCSGQDSASDLT